MVFRAVITVSLLFPLVGVFLLEMGSYGPDIDQVGHPNGATFALAVYTIVVLTTIKVADRSRIFYALGAGGGRRPYPLSVFKIVVLLLPMALFVLFVAGGIETIEGLQGSGGFRVALNSLTGIPSYLILKCYAPATFAYVALARAKAGRLWSLPTFVAGALLILIALSFGYKTGIILALLPAVTLLCWRTSRGTLFKLGVLAACMVVAAYVLMAGDDLSSAFEAIYSRIFLSHGGVPWKVWDVYVHGGELPSYVHTLPSIFSDRLYVALTGITPATETAWVKAHFTLAMTSFAAPGYTPQYLMEQGHNNAANAFSEGIVAGGVFGAFVVAVLAGLIINALYRLIDNSLKAGNFAVASLGACYLIYALMSWLIGGGITELVHSSVIFGMWSWYLVLRVVPTFGVPEMTRQVDLSVRGHDEIRV